MANTFTINDGGEVSLGNKKMLIGVVQYTDGAATEVTSPLTKVESVQTMVKSGTAIDGVTFTTASFKASTAASGDAHHTVLIGY